MRPIEPNLQPEAAPRLAIRDGVRAWFRLAATDLASQLPGGVEPQIRGPWGLLRLEAWRLNPPPPHSHLKGSADDNSDWLMVIAGLSRATQPNGDTPVGWVPLGAARSSDTILRQDGWPWNDAPTIAGQFDMQRGCCGLTLRLRQDKTAWSAGTRHGYAAQHEEPCFPDSISRLAMEAHDRWLTVHGDTPQSAPHLRVTTWQHDGLAMSWPLSCPSASLPAPWQNAEFVSGRRLGPHDLRLVTIAQGPVLDTAWSLGLMNPATMRKPIVQVQPTPPSTPTVAIKASRRPMMSGA